MSQFNIHTFKTFNIITKKKPLNLYITNKYFKYTNKLINLDYY